MERDSSSPKAYRDDVEGELSEILEAVREVLLEFVDESDEQIQYGMLDYPGLANLAAQKKYVSLYVAPDVLADYKSRFDGPSSGKSCLRFNKLEQVDRELLADLLADVREYRAAQS
jgi:uncharacterized protein YdhG (YjbR/CyaY superfamily)